MKKLYLALMVTLLAALTGLGVLSLVDTDPTFLPSENRPITKPQFTWSALADGSYMQSVESYYADTFPFHEQLMKLNRQLNQFYYYSGNDNYLALDFTGGAEQGGESLHDVQNALDGQSGAQDATSDTTTSQEPPAQSDGADAATDGETPASGETTTDMPQVDIPDESQATSIGTIIVVGDNAMDIPTATDSVIVSYADAVSNLAAAMGDGVRTLSLVTPNSGEFYSPESFHTGSHSQKAMIDLCYESMGDSVVTVDAYSALQAHADEYLYFRTDHHWTALGAYYAYTQYCAAAGFEPVPLEQFETGTYENFLGTMYTYTENYPQSEALRENPDTLTYYLPIVETHARYYSDTTLSDGIPISVVYTGLAENVANKYLCFIGGDTPVCIIETAVENGPVCMVVKESYGNALVPFLTSHYSKIVVIDPREFNQEGKPSLDLPAFAAEQGVDDLLVINYPFMINNSFYVSLLNRLVPADAAAS